MPKANNGKGIPYQKGMERAPNALKEEETAEIMFDTTS
jgi:hypothetical protein